MGGPPRSSASLWHLLFQKLCFQPKFTDSDLASVFSFKLSWRINIKIVWRKPRNRFRLQNTAVWAQAHEANFALKSFISGAKTSSLCLHQWHSYRNFSLIKLWRFHVCLLCGQSLPNIGARGGNYTKLTNRNTFLCFFRYFPEQDAKKLRK